MNQSLEDRLEAAYRTAETYALLWAEANQEVVRLQKSLDEMRQLVAETLALLTSFRERP